jgi:tripartite-type tricarboxylate transporter receptor subunit TctC
MFKLVRILSALACAAAAVVAQAQDYPAKPVRMVLPFSAGGGIDAVARALAQYLSQPLGQQVLVENKPGGTGVIGIEFVARSAPDGYTLLFIDPTLSINSLLLSKLPYDPVKDFVPITQVASLPFALVLPASLPVKDVRELIALAKAKPNALNYASFGVGSSAHLIMEAFQAAAGIQVNHVPYKGSAPALTDIAGGRVEMMFSSVGSVVSHWKTGKVTFLAVGGTSRFAKYPEVPTISESGLPGFEATSWFGLFAPAGTPREIIARINAETQKIVADPVFRDRYLDPQGLEPVVSSPQRFAEYTRADAARWARIVREAKVRLD